MSWWSQGTDRFASTGKFDAKKPEERQRIAEQTEGIHQCPTQLTLPPLKSAYLFLSDWRCRVALWSDRDVYRLQMDPHGVRKLAARILQRIVEPHALSEWEGYVFLPSIISQTQVGEFTIPQIEKLLEIDFLSRQFQLWDGVHTSRALQLCRKATVDMDEDDEEWIVELYERSPQTIYGRDVRRLTRLTRQFVYAETA